YTYYGLSQQGRASAPRQRTGWLVLAQTLLAGDDAAQAAGHPGMVNRTLLAEATTALTTALEAFAAQETIYQKQLAALLNSRLAAAQLCKDLVSELRHALRNLAPPHRRQIMRGYGLTFRTRPGEVLTDVPEVPPVAAVDAQTPPLADRA
ncbi:MAG: hypothetical protein R2867_11760, partial [Caldilineaceae bacterium]